MTQLNNKEYHVARAAAERTLTANAKDSGIAKVHCDMAERYDALSREAEPGLASSHIPTE